MTKTKRKVGAVGLFPGPSLEAWVSQLRACAKSSAPLGNHTQLFLGGQRKEVLQAGRAPFQSCASQTGSCINLTQASYRMWVLILWFWGERGDAAFLTSFLDVLILLANPLSGPGFRTEVLKGESAKESLGELISTQTSVPQLWRQFSQVGSEALHCNNSQGVLILLDDSWGSKSLVNFWANWV